MKYYDHINRIMSEYRSHSKIIEISVSSVLYNLLELINFSLRHVTNAINFA